MNSPQTHFNCLSGNLVEPVYYVGTDGFTVAAYPSTELDLLTKATLYTNMLAIYATPYDLLLEAIDFKCPAGGSNGAGLLTVDALTINGCALGAFTVATNVAGAITWDSTLKQVGSSIWRRLLMRDLYKLTTTGRTHKGALLTAGASLSDASIMMACSLTSGAYTGTKYIGLRLIFKNVDEQKLTVASLAL